MNRASRILAAVALIAAFETEALAAVNPVGTANFATNQATATAAVPNAPLVPARISRSSVLVENLGTTQVWLGGPNVTVATGMLLPGVAGSTITMPVQGAIYGITASGSQAVSYLEIY